MEIINRPESLYLSAAALVLSEFDWKRLWFKPIVALLENVALTVVLGLLFEYLVPPGIRILVPTLTLVFLGIFYRRPPPNLRGEYQMSRWERMFSRIGVMVTLGWNVGKMLLADNPGVSLDEKTPASEKTQQSAENLMGAMSPLLGSLLNSPMVQGILNAEERDSGPKKTTEQPRRTRPVYDE